MYRDVVFGRLLLFWLGSLRLFLSVLILCRDRSQDEISPHYRSEGRRQVSGGFFGGSMALSEDYRDKCHKI